MLVFCHSSHLSILHVCSFWQLHENIINTSVLIYIANHHLLTHHPLVFLPVPLIKAEPVDEYQYRQLGHSVSQVCGVSPQSCQHTAQLPCAMPCQVSQRTSSPTLYPQASEYPLHQPSALYQSQVEALSSSPGHYQPSLDHPASGAQALGPNPAAHLKPSSYQHIIAGHSYQAGVSMFPGLDAANQRSFVQRPAPPVQSYNHRQPVEHQRTSSPVRVKQENLDQAYLDDGEFGCFDTSTSEYILVTRRL